MKIGDKLYCIKNVEYYYRNTKRITHIKGNFYDATDYGKNKDMEYVYIESEKFTTNYGYLGFFISGDKTSFPSWYFFDEHFVTLQKYRKQKLEKIENERKYF